MIIHFSWGTHRHNFFRLHLISYRQFFKETKTLLRFLKAGLLTFYPRLILTASP
jgi:hypothetical protein